MSLGIRLLLVPAFLFTHCQKEQTSFGHDFTFDATSGDLGITESQTTSDPNDPYAFSVDVAGSDALSPSELSVVAFVECGDRPGVQNPHPVTLRSVGLGTLVGDFSSAAPECIDSETGQQSSATWHIEVRRLEPSVGFTVEIQGTLG